MTSRLNVSLVRSERAFLEQKLASFLGAPYEDASVCSRSRRRAIQSFDQIRSVLKDWPDWYAPKGFLHGPKIDDRAEAFKNELAFDMPTSAADTDHLCREIAACFSWALVRWFGTFRDSVQAFVSDDAALFERFLESGCNRAPTNAGEGSERDMIVATYRNVSKLSEACSIVTFDDYGREGAVAWALADGDKAPPILICEVGQVDATDETLALLDRLPHINEPFEVGSSFYRERIALYSAVDRDVYDALWSRAGHDDHVVAFAVGAHADPERLRRALMEQRKDPYQRDDFDEIRALADIGGWAYRHTYGGGADEYFAWVACRESEATVQAIALIEDAHLGTEFTGIF